MASVMLRDHHDSVFYGDLPESVVGYVSGTPKIIVMNACYQNSAEHDYYVALLQDLLLQNQNTDFLLTISGADAVPVRFKNI